MPVPAADAGGGRGGTPAIALGTRAATTSAKDLRRRHNGGVGDAWTDGLGEELREDGEGSPMHLPEEPIPDPSVLLHIEPLAVSLGAKFAAIGSHIIAISPSTMGRVAVQQSRSVTLTFHTRTRKLVVSHVLPEGLLCGYHVAIPARDMLYVFESFTCGGGALYRSDFHGGLHCISMGPCEDDSAHWGWLPLSYFSPLVWSWSHPIPNFPFDPKTVAGHAVHPKTGTIFVSADVHGTFGTFSCDMGGRGKWKWVGDWVLPFKGHSHYDDALDAWVGLAGDAGGYLCACSVMSGSQQPDWQVGEEKLFLKHPSWSHVDAKLVHMGQGSKYCLVERLLPKGADKTKREDKIKYVLRLATFIVNYDVDGDLKIMAHQPDRFYKVPSYRCHSEKMRSGR